MYEELKHKLKSFPIWRERRERKRLIADHILKQYGLYGKPINPDMLEELATEFDSYDRTWRKVLQDCPELRGTDYNDGKKVEQLKQMELGYEPNYKENVRKLKTL